MNLEELKLCKKLLSIPEIRRVLLSDVTWEMLLHFEKYTLSTIPEFVDHHKYTRQAAYLASYNLLKASFIKKDGIIDNETVGHNPMMYRFNRHSLRRTDE